VKITTAYEKTVFHPACRDLMAGDRDKKKNHQAVPKRPPDKGQNSSKRPPVGPEGMEGKGKRREEEG